MKEPKSIAVIGGGISGLSAAYRIRERLPAATVLVLESGSRPGGNIATVEREGFRVETGPNGFLDSKPSTMQLCRDLGLGDRLLAASEGSRKNRYLLLNGKLTALPGSLWSFVKSPVLSWRGKLNLMLEKYRRRPADAPDDESVAGFASRRAGREVASVLADAIVTGIHAGDPALLSAGAAFPRLLQFEREHGSVMRGFTAASRQRRREAEARGEQPQPQRMWSFREGLQVLVDGLRERLSDSLITGAGIRSIVREADGRWVIRGDGRDEWRADAVVLTCPSDRQAALLAEADPALAEELSAIPYTPVAVVAVGYRQADLPAMNLDGFGFIAPQSSRRDLLGVQWCSSIFSARAPEGMTLWRALCGGWNRPEIIGWDDARLLSAVRGELRSIMGVTATPVFTHIARWPRAIPQYHVGHLARVARIDAAVTRHPGLFLGGNALRGVAINDCTEQAGLLAEKIAGSN